MKFYTGTFDLLVFKVILGSFGALCEIWNGGVAVNMYMAYL